MDSTPQQTSLAGITLMLWFRSRLNPLLTLLLQNLVCLVLQNQTGGLIRGTKRQLTMLSSRTSLAVNLPG